MSAGQPSKPESGSALSREQILRALQSLVVKTQYLVEGLFEEGKVGRISLYKRWSMR